MFKIFFIPQILWIELAFFSKIIQSLNPCKTVEHLISVRIRENKPENLPSDSRFDSQIVVYYLGYY